MQRRVPNPSDTPKAQGISITGEGKKEYESQRNVMSAERIFICDRETVPRKCP